MQVYLRGFFDIVKLKFHKTALQLNENVIYCVIYTYNIKNMKIKLVFLLTNAEIPVTMRMK